MIQPVTLLSPSRYFPTELNPFLKIHANNDREITSLDVRSEEVGWCECVELLE